MKLFRQLLNEQNQITDKDAVVDWIRDHRYKHSSGGEAYDPDAQIYVDHNGTVTNKAKLGLDTDDGELPIKFAASYANFYLMHGIHEGSKIKSLKGVPTEIRGDFHFDGDIHPNTDYPKTVDGDFYAPEVTNFHDIHKYVKRIEGYLYVYDCTKNLLGPILIPGIKGVKYDSTATDTDRKIVRAIAIINKHIGKGKPGIIAAQEELIDNDLDEYANL